MNHLYFIHDAAQFSNKSVDICLPGFSKYNIALCDEEILKNSNISQITVVEFKGDKKEERIHKIGNKKGKEIRVIDPGSLSAKDFKLMIGLSAPLVGCTGDNSLAQTLSAGKIPFYENRFPIKNASLLNRIAARFGDESALYQYCKNSMTEDSVMPSKTKLIEEAKLLGELIREEVTFQPILNGVVNEKLLRQKDADFADREDQLENAYLDDKISLEELNHQFVDLLKEKGLL